MSAEMEQAAAWVSADVGDAGRAALFSPLQIGSQRLTNRFLMSAMGTRLATADGYITDANVAYYARRARGGVGSIVVEGTSMDPGGITYPGKPRIYDDRFIPGLARVATAIAHEGSLPGVQIMHAGRHTSQLTRTGPALSPSGGSSLSQPGGSRPATDDELWSIVENFALASVRAGEAGYRLVELHGAHGYLLHDFLSPLSNHRDDSWGGDLPRRSKLLVEVVRAVRAAVADELAVVVRLSSTEFEATGLTVYDALYNAVQAQDAGADAILVSGGNNEHLEWIVPPVLVEPGLYLENARRIRQGLEIPVIVVGRVAQPQLAAEAVVSGAADAVALGRALLADPDFVAKIGGSRPGPVRPCIACNECLAQHMRDHSVLCSVNPEAGREAEPEPAAAPGRPRSIMVVGAGPAGMLFSILAAGRGHDVTLVERSDRVGGKLWLAAAAPYKTVEMLALLASLEDELERSGVRLELGVGDARLCDVAAQEPDLVVLAMGAIPRAPDVDTPGGLVEAETYLTQAAEPPWSTVAILGAGDTACDAAMRLAERGVAVTMLARGDRIARGIEPVTSKLLRRRLRELNVAVIRRSEVSFASASHVDYLDGDGQTRALDVDQVLYARGVVPRRVDADTQPAGPAETVVIGDAHEPGNFMTAMASAWELARRL